LHLPKRAVGSSVAFDLRGKAKKEAIMWYRNAITVITLGVAGLSACDDNDEKGGEDVLSPISGWGS
jgi:hypothetical protein